MYRRLFRTGEPDRVSPVGSAIRRNGGGILVVKTNLRGGWGEGGICERPRTSDLCVGNDQMLLQTRCAVLHKSAYQAEAASPAEANRIMRHGGYDHVILSISLSDEERSGVIASIPAGTKILKLDHFIGPYDLLVSVGQLLLSGKRPITNTNRPKVRSSRYQQA
jgi:hypothetical protein